MEEASVKDEAGVSSEEDEVIELKLTQSTDSSSDDGSIAVKIAAEVMMHSSIIIHDLKMLLQ